MAIPVWKLTREIRRIGSHIAGLPSGLDNFLFATSRYDRKLRRQIRLFQGRLPCSARIAIYLIFPASGLQKSHLLALDYFRKKGYAVQVVSNVPVSENDRTILLDHCWSYMERPNFGYDFGGYRDAVLGLEGNLAQLERLVLFNDSTWFPLPGSRDWLDDVEALGVDFAGAASNYGTPRPEIEDFRSISWSYGPAHRNFHYCSFALCLRPAVFRHPDFRRFWKKLRLTDKKNRTVRRGEIGLSQWALARGFSHGSTLDVTGLARELNTLDDARLFEIALDLVVMEDARLRDLQQRVVSAPAPVRDDLIALVLLVVSRQGASYALAPYAVREKGYPFLKKSPVWLSQPSSDATLRLARRLEGDGAADILTEVAELRSRLSGGDVRPVEAGDNEARSPRGPE